MTRTGESARGARVEKAFPATRLAAAAYGSVLDTGTPEAKQTDAGGGGEFWAPPPGYAVYASGA